jgi:uncharacterized membrane protein YphA (DoxX/SURF4 family)
MSFGLKPTLAPVAAPLQTDAPRWKFAQCLLFRFAFVYLVLYILPFPIEPAADLVERLATLARGEEPATPGDEPRGVNKLASDWVLKPYEEFWDKIVLWTGKKVFNVDIVYRPAGSGDTTWNYVQVFCFAVLSSVAAVGWTLAALVSGRLLRRERSAYPLLHDWLRVYVRFYVAYMMFIYGMFKVIKLQFPHPGTETLLHTYGESSPMHLLWTFMGASEGYNWFTGAGEMLGGLLLCTRRTTLLGALVSCAVMTHVAALNFCYDVPVKLFSLHLVLMSLFLMAPDLPWLAQVFLLGRSKQSRAIAPLTKWRWLDGFLVALRTALVLTLLGLSLYDNHKQRKQIGDLAPRPPLSGLWDVEEFSLDGNVRLPIVTDASRWQRVVINKGFMGPMFMITSMTGAKSGYQVEVDTDAKTLSLSRMGAPGPDGQPPKKQVLRYQEPETGVIVVEGELETNAGGKAVKNQIKARLRHIDDERFLLQSRGFHWINEYPYNRFVSRYSPLPPDPPPMKRP